MCVCVDVLHLNKVVCYTDKEDRTTTSVTLILQSNLIFSCPV